MNQPKIKFITPKQIKALHVFFQGLADNLNLSGLDMKKVLKPEVDIPWSKLTIKEYIWRPVMKAQLIKDSITQMTTKEVNLVLETINRHLGDKFGIHEPFPTIEEIERTLIIKPKK